MTRDTHDPIRFGQLLDTLDAIVWEADARTLVFSYVSGGAERMLGYPREAWLEEGFWASLIHPDDRDRTVAFCLAATNDCRDHEFEYRAMTADGRTVWLHDIVRIITGPDGAAEQLRGVMVDITDQKARDSDLREREERMRAILDFAPVGLATVDFEGRLINCNPAFEQMLYYSEEELQKMSITDITHPEDAPTDWVLFQELMAGKRDHFELDKRYIRKDGEIVWAHLIAAAIRDAQGKPRFGVGMVEDITEKRRGEEERARLERELTQAQKMEAVGQLAGGVAHDFNNLLSTVLNYGALIAERSRDAGVREDAEEIVQAGERGAALTRQLLMFSRQERPRLEALDINEVVSNLEKMLARTLGEHIDLCTNLADGLPVVHADRMQLEQVVLNLSVNARDAMPEGGTLSISTSAAPGGISISVSDNGTGMSREVRERAFEPFFTTKPIDKGTGLGLSTVYGIVTALDGNVEISSREGHGSTITVTIPGGGRPTEEESPHTTEAIGGRGEQILLVEDDPSIRRVTKRLLDASGYEVIDSEGPLEALQLIEDRALQFDALVTDVVMPRMSGVELAARLREAMPKLRVLYVSGYPREVLMSHGELEGPLLEKPFTRRSLGQALDDLFWSS